MRQNRKIEADIRRAFCGAVPDVLDGILADCDQEKGTVIVMEKKKTNPEINLELAKPFADYNKHLQNDYGRRLRAIETAADRVTVVSDGADEAADYICQKYNWDDVVEKTLNLYRG